MNFALADGVWPTMLTPFDSSGEVDYAALGELTEWYIGHGVAGLFAVCQSSEMFSLSLGEREAIARFVTERAAGRCGVIASGHISDDPSAQAEGLQVMAATGVDAIVLVTNRMASETEPDEVWQRRTEDLLRSVDLSLGLYECPYPYKRLLSRGLLQWASSTGRFHFLKNTSCDREIEWDRAQVARGGNLKLYNAHSASLLYSLRQGYSGYSGVMANFHPDLYVWLHREHAERPLEAERLQAYLGVAALIEEHGYPLNAKYFLRQEGLALDLTTRVRREPLPDAWQLELTELSTVTEALRRSVHIKSDATK